MRTILTTLILAPVLLATAGYPVEITGVPDVAPVSLMQVTVFWGTNVPSDSLVEYGADGELTYSCYDPTYTTTHEVTVPLHLIDNAYDFRVTSTDGASDPAVDYTWYFNRENLVELQLPEADEIVSGVEVWLRGAPSHANIEVMQALFEVIPDATGIPIYIGQDLDGTEFKYATYLPSPPGDGWSAGTRRCSLKAATRSG